MLKTEGVYTYLCYDCSSLTAITARLSMPADRKSVVVCPICNGVSELYGEGHIQYQPFINLENRTQETINQTKEEKKIKETNKEPVKKQPLPEILTAEDVAACLGISRQSAYELFKQTDFPVVPVGRLKRVYKNEFEKWLAQNEK